MSRNPLDALADLYPEGTRYLRRVFIPCVRVCRCIRFGDGDGDGNGDGNGDGESEIWSSDGVNGSWVEWIF